MTIQTSAQTVDGGGVVSLDATASDPDGDTLTYSWSGTGGTFTNASAVDTTWTAPAAQATDQSYTLTITVSDGSLSAADSVVMTVRRIPPNRPPSVTIQTSAQTVDGSAAVSLDATASDLDGDSLTYSWSGTGGTFTNASAVDTTWTAPAAQATDQSYTLTITVSDGSLSAADSVVMEVRKVVPPTPTPPPPALPVVSVSLQDAAQVTVTEGATVTFVVSSDVVVPAGGLAVNVWIYNRNGKVTTDTGPDTLTIDSTGNVARSITTLDDGLDEDDGELTLEVKSGTGYQISTTDGSATSTVRDDDAPEALTGLRIHGHQEANGVTVRWNTVPRQGTRFAIYHLWYADCLWVSDTGCKATNDWTPRPGVSTTSEGRLTGLENNKPYMVKVTATVGNEHTPWHDKVAEFAIVYPTTSTPQRTPVGNEGDFTKPLIGTIPLETHQPRGHFNYKLCTPAQSIPGGPQKPPADFITIQNAIRKVEESVKWRSSPSSNIIGSSLTTTEDCEVRPGDPNDRTIVFYEEDEFEAACTPEDDRRTYGCFGFRQNRSYFVTAPTFQYIVFDIAYDWGTIVTEADGDTCTRLQATIQHETLHAYGIGHPVPPLFKDALVSPVWMRWPLCEPTKYDVVALMVNYQSRR